MLTPKITELVYFSWIKQKKPLHPWAAFLLLKYINHSIHLRCKPIWEVGEIKWELMGKKEELEVQKDSQEDDCAFFHRFRAITVLFLSAFLPFLFFCSLCNKLLQLLFQWQLLQMQHTQQRLSVLSLSPSAYYSLNVRARFTRTDWD